jgi:hypothetical protein
VSQRGESREMEPVVGRRIDQHRDNDSAHQ